MSDTQENDQLEYSYEYYNSEYKFLNYKSYNDKNIIKEIFCDYVDILLSPLFHYTIILTDSRKISFNDLFLIKQYITIDDLNVILKYIDYFNSLKKKDILLYNHTNYNYILYDLHKNYDKLYDYYDFITRRINFIYDEQGIIIM